MRNPKTVVVDIDGTVSTRCDRDPFDLSKVSGDYPIDVVIGVVRDLEAQGWQIVYLTARGGSAFEATEKWLFENDRSLRHRPLFIRKDDDLKDDVEIKDELYRRYIRPFYDVKLAFDDNTNVIAWWRSLGVTAFHVAEGLV